MEIDIVNQTNENRCRACMTEELPKNMISLLDGENLQLFSKCTSLEVKSQIKFSTFLPIHLNTFSF